MLDLLLGADRLENTNTLLGRITSRADEGCGGQILIVPEQYSHETERALCRAGGDGISRCAEVLSFTRLSSRVFSLYGGVCEEYLDEGGRLLTMYLAVQQVLPQIKFYAAACTKPEFLKRLCASMEEFLSCLLSPASLLEAAAQVSGSFAQKLTELGLLYESYLSVCKTGRNDPVTRLLRLGELLEREPYARGKRFYLDGFSDFTAAELRIVSALVASADEVTVALADDGSDSGAFRTAGATGRALARIAERLGAECRVERLPRGSGRPPELSYWLGRLFSAGAEPYEGKANAVLLHRAASPEQECRFAASYVRQLTRAGLRCRDVSVAVSDPGLYLPLLRPVFARSGLPAYCAGDRDILTQPVFAALLAAMRSVERYDTDEVLRYLKSCISPLSEDACDRLERYARFWNIRGVSWEKEWTLHPGGYGESWDDESRTALALLNTWRQAAVAPLAHLRRAWRAAPDTKSLVQALYAFTQEISLRDTLQELTDGALREGALQAAQQTRQLAEILLGAMEQTVRVLGACQMEPEQFVQLFTMLLGCYQVGSIPAAADEVQIGGLSSFRHRSSRVLLVLGAEDGSLPSFQAPLGIFTDDERKRLLSLGVTLSPAQEAQIDRELGWIQAAFCCGTETVCLSCASEQPSYLWVRTQEIFPQNRPTGPEDFPYLPDAQRAASLLLRQGGGQAAADGDPLLLVCMKDLGEKRAYRFEPMSMDFVKGLYGSELRLSASRIDRFAACKYACFLDYGLKAKPWKQAKFDAPVFGTFVHCVLEGTVRDVRAAGGFRKVSEEELAEIAQRRAEEYTKTYMPDLSERGERFDYLYRRNLGEVLAVVQDVGRELRASRFEPADEELSFSKDGPLPPVEVEGRLGRSVISGTVDRVDLYRRDGKLYFRIVDYKTGRKDFDYADILNGENLQMLIYLFALQKYGAARYGAQPIPAGVLYVPAREDMERVDPGSPEQAEKARIAQRRRKGLVLDDKALLEAMEENTDAPQYLPVQMKSGALQGDLATQEQLALLERFVQRTLAGMTDRMLRGDVTPDPIFRGPQRSSCQYCDFAAACHKDSCEHINRYIAAVRAKNFWEELERRENNG